MKYLLQDQEENTTGTQESFQFISQAYNNGKGAVYAFGTFDTCTVTLEFSPDKGETWIAVGADTTFTAVGWSNFEIQGIVDLRGSVTSVGTGTIVSLVIL